MRGAEGVIGGDTVTLAAGETPAELAEMIGLFDWASTSLGPIESWSAELRVAIDICVRSRFPMTVAWGPDFVRVYNDAYRPMLGDKHPAALGTPSREVWGEVWDVIEPLIQAVLTTGESLLIEHQRLVLERHGFPEECFITYSYSPLVDRDGVGGVLCVATETTNEIVTARRLACLARLNTALWAEQVTDLAVRAVTALGHDPFDVCTADIYLRVDGHVALIASNRHNDVAAPQTGILETVLSTGTALTVSDSGDTRPAQRHVVPIGRGNESIQGVLVAGLNAGRPFDTAYRTFVSVVADAISNALDGAYRRTVELGEYRMISDTLQAAMIKPASDLPTVAARYLPAVGNLAVGGDWYDIIELGEHRRGLVVGDCVGHGLEAATVMAQLRSATRAAMLDGRSPAQVLDSLDLFATSLPGAYCATVVCAVFDRAHASVTYARAGHPPPLVVNPARISWLDQATSTPIGVTPLTPRDNAEFHLETDDVIILYSDGLIERRNETLDAGLQRLATAARQLHGHDVQHIADELLHRLEPENTRDDVVLVVKSLASPTPIPET